MFPTWRGNRRAVDESRAIGAISGLVPATMILGWYLGTGGTATPGLVWIVMVAVVTGWIVGPRVQGSIRTDLGAAAWYFAVSHLLQAATDALIVLFEEIQAGLASEPLEVFLSLVVFWLGRVAYLPVWALFLSPAALGWAIAAHELRRLPRGGTRPTADENSPPGSS